MVLSVARFYPSCLMFALMVAYVPHTVTPSAVGRWFIVALLSTLVFAVKIEFNLPVKLLTMLLGWMVLGLLWSVSPWDTFGCIVHWGALGVLFIWAMQQRDLTTMWIAFILGVTVSVPFVLLQNFGYHPVQDLARFGFEPLAGLFLLNNLVAELGALAVIVAIGIEQPFLAIGPGILVFLTGQRERVGWLMLLVAVFAYVWFGGGNERGRQGLIHRRAAVIGAVAIFASMVVGYLYANDLYGEYWYWSDKARLDIWLDTLRHLTILGGGAETYQAVFPAYPHAHNEILQLAFELGIGSVLLFWMVGYGLCADVLLERTLLVAYLAAAMVWVPTVDPPMAVIGVLLTGYLCGHRYRVRVAQPAGRVQGVPGIEPIYGYPHSPVRIRRPDKGNPVVPDGFQSSSGAGIL